MGGRVSSRRPSWRTSCPRRRWSTSCATIIATGSRTLSGRVYGNGASSMRRYYIGLATTFHDPAVAIVGPTGEILFAEATERHMQSKRALNCDPDALMRMPALLREHCDPDADLVVATPWSQPFT